MTNDNKSFCRRIHSSSSPSIMAFQSSSSPTSFVVCKKKECFLNSNGFGAMAYRNDRHSKLSMTSSLSSSPRIMIPSLLLNDSTTNTSVMTTEDIVVGTIVALALAFAWIALQQLQTTTTSTPTRTTSSSTFVDLWSSPPSTTKSDNPQPSSSSTTNIPSQQTPNNDFDVTAIHSQEEDNDMEIDVRTKPSNEKETSMIDDKTVPKENEDINVLNWKEISRPENYVLYSTRVKQRLSKMSNNSNNNKIQLLEEDIVTTTTTTKKEKKWVFFSLLVLFVPIFSIEFFFALSRQFMCGDTIMNGSSHSWAQELCSAHF